MNRSLLAPSRALPIAQPVPAIGVNCAIDMSEELVDLHQAFHMPLLSTASGTRNPAMGCFALVLGIRPLTGVGSPALMGLDDTVDYGACGSTSPWLKLVCRLDREAPRWGIGTYQ